jgi:hypothetical protein
VTSGGWTILSAAYGYPLYPSKRVHCRRPPHDLHAMQLSANETQCGRIGPAVS